MFRRGPQLLRRRTDGVPRRSRRGFSLPEVLATLVFLGIALPATMTAVSTALRAATAAAQRVEAAAIAQDKLNQLLAVGVNGGASGSGIVETGPRRYDWRWESRLTGDLGLTNLIEVTVEVSWVERGGNQAVALTSLYYNTGIQSQGVIQ
jgi:prepilin-type N-terminal cleavage/methylation domain-containing protein